MPNSTLKAKKQVQKGTQARDGLSQGRINPRLEKKRQGEVLEL